MDDFNNGRQPEMAAETGNTYIFENVTALKWQQQIWGLSVGRWLQQRPTTRNSDMTAKTENSYISARLELWQIALKLQRQIRYFRPWQALLLRKCSKVTATTSHSPKMARLVPKTSMFLFPIVGRCAIPDSPGTVLRARRGRNLRFAVRISTLS